MKRLLLTVMTVLLLDVGSAWAGPFEDGTAAYQRGDYKESVRLDRLAAAQGDARGQTRLGMAYEYGEGVEQDYAESVKWYRLAAAQGEATAQLNLSFMY